MPDGPRSTPLEWSHVYDFQHLMARRVENIILVSSAYDTFILQEDGLLSELMLGEFLNLHLHHTTGLTHVSSGAEAIALATAESRFNLIVAAINLGDMNAAELARKVKETGLAVPVVLLAFDGGELAEFAARHDISELERIFLWQGDPRILLAITKYVEDKLNAAYDVGAAGVQAILLIEDNIRYYSSFLPVIYTEIINHSQRLIAGDMSVAHRILAMRARPKILLCANFEEAWDYFTAYQENVLGLISDVEFPQGGELRPDAGVEFTRRVKQAWPDIPVLLQSSRPESEALAREVGADFLLKGSPTLLDDLRKFMIDNFAFGDFVFQLPDGTQVGRAKNMNSLLEMLRTVPLESVTYHAERNDFSRWLKARTEFHLAHHLRPHTAADYDTAESRRDYLIGELNAYRHEQARGSVSDFDPNTFDPDNSFARIGEGSLGGKARALAFMRHLLRDYDVTDQFPGIRITVPPCVVLTTDVFDAFLEENDLHAFAIRSNDDKEIEERFLAGVFSPEVERSLAAYLDLVDYPLAVRSSSLLEDSQYQPLAGVYDTYLIPNNDPSSATRLHQLVRAAKRVFASTFLTYAKNCFKVTPYRLEEEKMAVIVQRLVGTQHGTRFYPDFAGVGRSYNFYPSGPLRAEDGIVTVALGLGRTVVNGELALSFAPKHPQHLVQFSTVEDMLANSQRGFVALELDGEDEISERSFPLEVAESDGTLAAVASTYSPENDAVYDGVSRPGIRLVSFAPILKQRSFPLPAALDRLMELGRKGMNSEIEIEFAVRLPHSAHDATDFGFVQMRPMLLSRELEDLDVDGLDPADLLARSARVLGNGKMADIQDVLVVDPTRFDRAKSREIATEVARLNSSMVTEGVPYILIGLGRWGSADPWLGIPVTWEQISGARVIVESGLKDIQVAPSQGSHFFQNLTSFRVGYFTVDEAGKEGFLDWEWLAAQPAVQEGTYVRRLHFPEPLVVAINGKRQRGAILKPGTALP
ncbi:MAG: histidine kinase [Actinobacteria bacterium RBG_16_64_13]|nr:MAG: histidine kinase [Actinobacteria bacterium RBG_16_64_13]